jgi:hypothetical protein
MEVRIGIIKSAYEAKRLEGYAIIDGIKKELTPELLAELKSLKAAGKIKSQNQFWLNDNGNPLQSA